MKINKTSKKFIETINGKPKRIYFLFPVYLVGGGETYACRMIEYLLAYTDIKIGVIDFKDGMLTRTCKKFFPKTDIDYIDYEKSRWTLDDDSIIFAGADHLGTIKHIIGKNIRIQVDVWEAIFGWDVLFERKTKWKIAKLLKEHNGASFIDIGCYLAACKQLKQKFKQLYMPLFYYTPKPKNYKKETPDNEVNLVWLGRFAGSKEEAIYNIIDNFAQYETTKKKVFHLIGNGPVENRIKEYTKKYSKNIKFIFPGVMTGEDLSSYIQKNADIGVAMGTSMLNIGSLGVPCIALPQSKERITIKKFLWLNDMYGGCCGTPLEDNEIFRPMYDKLQSFDSMVDDICKYGKRQEIGEAGRKFYEKSYGSLEYCGRTFLETLCQTTLTYELLKKALKFMPYNDVHGLAVQTYRFLHIPFLKAKRWGGKTRYFFFGLPILKMYFHGTKKKIYLFGVPFIKFVKDSHKSSISILGIKIFDIYLWGRYAYYEATNSKVKKECKDKFAINQRIIK